MAKKKNSEQEITLNEFLHLYNNIYQGCLMHIARYFPQFDDEQTRDICSDTMAKAFSRFHTYDATKGAFTTWLYTIANNTAIDFINDSKKQPSTSISLPLPGGDDDEDEYHIDIEDADSKNPMDEILEKEMEEKKRTNFAKLDPIDQKILAMREDGRPFNEIAEFLGIPSTTARTRSRRATLKLKKWMEMSDEIA